MPVCDYCEETFDTEQAYLAHLQRAHEGELSTVDERKVATVDHSAVDDGAGAGVALVGMILVTGLLAFGYLLVF